jgi:hypothetical protein
MMLDKILEWMGRAAGRAAAATLFPAIVKRVTIHHTNKTILKLKILIKCFVMVPRLVYRTREHRDKE